MATGVAMTTYMLACGGGGHTCNKSGHSRNDLVWTLNTRYIGDTLPVHISVTITLPNAYEWSELRITTNAHQKTEAAIDCGTFEDMYGM